MIQVFNSFQNNINERVNLYGVGNLTEDNIRYDFFNSITRILPAIESYQIQLEAPFPNEMFNRRAFVENAGRGRSNSEKPEIDLITNTGQQIYEYDLVSEFALFKTPEVAKNQDRSGRHCKLVNDIIRLALMSYSLGVNYKSLMILVTDNEMLRFGNIRNNGIPLQETYNITQEFLNNLPTKSRQSKIESRFYDKSVELGIIPTANLLFGNLAVENNNNMSTIIWEVSFIHR